MFLLLIWYKKNKNMKIFGSNLLNLALLLGYPLSGHSQCSTSDCITSNYSYHDAFTIFLFEKTEQVRDQPVASRVRNIGKEAGLSINCSTK
jgi:hypothetical protein